MTLMLEGYCRFGRHDSGVVNVQPDSSEQKSAWPSPWYENEYAVDAVSSFILVSNAANAEPSRQEQKSSARGGR